MYGWLVPGQDLGKGKGRGKLELSVLGIGEEGLYRGLVMVGLMLWEGMSDANGESFWNCLTGLNQSDGMVFSLYIFLCFSVHFPT